jgi:enamine deaminase RidA (YjgF/YER057c/UK114 family)
MSIQQNILELGIEIPQASKPVANYVGARKLGNTIYLSGQLPVENGQIKYIGKVGKSISEADATKAAELCALNILSQLSAILSGDLDSIQSCVKLNIFINAIPEFENHSLIANGASDFIVKVMGDKGIHARSTVGVASLPKNVAVEIEGIFTINS